MQRLITKAWARLATASVERYAKTSGFCVVNARLGNPDGRGAKAAIRKR